MFCENCGNKLSGDLLVCSKCGCAILLNKKNSNNGDGGLHMIAPVNTSGMSIVAGYFGLFSLLVVPAPFAVLFGILGLLDIKKNPSKYGKGRAYFGIIMGSIIILAMLFIFLKGI